MNRKALGRGLGALLSADSTVDLGAEPSEVDLDSIVPGPMQPRTHFDEASLESLADSIRTHGIVQPLLVRRRDGGYELIAGERRWRAAREAGIDAVPGEHLLVAETDEEFIDAIASLIVDRTRRVTLGREAHRWARENLSWDRSAADFERLYDAVSPVAHSAGKT